MGAPGPQDEHEELKEPKDEVTDKPKEQPHEEGHAEVEGKPLGKRGRQVGPARRRRVLRRLKARWEAGLAAAAVPGNSEPTLLESRDDRKEDMRLEPPAGRTSVAEQAACSGEAAITEYSWADGKKQVSVYIELDGLDEVAEEALVTESGEKSVCFTVAPAGGQRRRFLLTNLFRGIDGVKMQRRVGRNQVVLRLLKKEQRPWYSLTRGSGGRTSSDEDDMGGGAAGGTYLADTISRTSRRWLPWWRTSWRMGRAPTRTQLRERNTGRHPRRTPSVTPSWMSPTKLTARPCTRGPARRRPEFVVWP